jgi:hypothetical protein
LKPSGRPLRSFLHGLKILKLAEDVALVGGTVAVGETIVARRKLGFAGKALNATRSIT